MSRAWDKRAVATVVVLATVALSVDSPHKLAELCGFTGPLGWVWPLCLDAVAYLATRIWLEKGSAYRFARALTVASITLSLIANGLVHDLTEYGIHPHWMIVVLVGAVPPAMLALVVHMLVIDRPANLAAGPGGHLVTEPHQVAAEQPHQPGDQPEPAHQVQAASAVHQPDENLATEAHQPGDAKRRQVHQVTDEDLVTRARQVLAIARAEGRQVGRARLARELGITEHQARQILAEAARPHLAAVHPEPAEEVAVNG